MAGGGQAGKLSNRKSYGTSTKSSGEGKKKYFFSVCESDVHIMVISVSQTHILTLDC